MNDLNPSRKLAALMLNCFLTAKRTLKTWTAYAVSCSGLDGTPGDVGNGADLQEPLFLEPLRKTFSEIFSKGVKTD